jgi:hypothetical protein
MVFTIPIRRQRCQLSESVSPKFLYVSASD